MTPLRISSSLVAIAIAQLISMLSSAERPQNGNQLIATGPLWMQETRNNLSISSKLDDILKRVGPNIGASSDYHDFQDIHLSDSIEAWKLMHNQIQQFAHHQAQFYKPILEKLLIESNVSETCRRNVEMMINSAGQLESRAMKMWSSSGSFPPTGFYDGSFTDLGSFWGCINAGSSTNFTSYCSVAFRPVIPSRKKFHMISQEEPEELVNLYRDKQSDIFNEMLHLAQYYHYLYVKTAVCVPHQCSQYDVQQVAGNIGKHLALMTGPVKCFSRGPKIESRSNRSRFEFGKIENEPVLVTIGERMNFAQSVSAYLVSIFFATVFLATFWHIAEIGARKVTERQETDPATGYELEEKGELADKQKETRILQPIENKGIKRIAFEYFSLVTNGREFLDTSMRSNEIKCLHGLRVFTMAWIICVHSFQYNEWSGFSRVYELLGTLQNPFLHPIYNANYVVDNFFLMSGLLAAYTIWYAQKGTSSNYSVISSLIGRYLRLTPQVLLISLLYILLPLAGTGPLWYDVTHHSAVFCEKNWWINLLHLQSFYREDEICNLVGWWISVDMFYYILALGLIFLILKNKQNQALYLTSLLVGLCVIATAYRHYIGGYPPNNLGTVPQVAEVWTRYVVNFFWSPLPHAYPFYLGLWIGYILANNKWRLQVRRWSRVGWAFALISLFTVNMSSHLWMSGIVDLNNQSQYISTVYNVICTLVWASAFGWIIVACHYGTAPKLNKILSLRLFVLISKASFIIYLSHMLVLRLYFGLQSSVLELSPFTMIYVITGNIFLSTLFGIFLCVSFESPCMKFQKYVLNQLRSTYQPPVPGSNYNNAIPNEASADYKVNFGPASKALLK